ncbi:MAG: bifunctional phosphopantothenoylcysteine decarboxylase/phosphopantothenate--cysteine ligase CoaBC [Bacteroidota bacterium]|nr:bifunctional phosphopantothenoylcysteine decarboxylase/phosphopantothenate--cysteine ligase CoaBC [Bacteroidota bacterium]
MNLGKKKILLGITGSIAAYKIPMLIRELKKLDAEVKVICTPDALNFVTAPTLSTLSGNPVYADFIKNLNGEWVNHVELALWADVILIAPATANTLAKLANGQSDNLLVATVMSARCPIIIAPAMDHDMYIYPATQNNIEKLRSYGHHIVNPENGELASGLIGQGRLPEEQTLVNCIQMVLTTEKKFAGKTILVTAGPTQEAIDPVRFISNHSTGKMGIAIAKEFALHGAKVIFVHGPIGMQPDSVFGGLDIEAIDTIDAEQMYKNVSKFFKTSDICIMAAAVADYKPNVVALKKIKKGADAAKLELVKTTDILYNLGQTKRKGQTLIGFALETDHEEKNAISKLKNKNLDMIVLNSLNNKGAGFKYNTNQVTMICKNGDKVKTALKNKNDIALDILNQIHKIRI